MCCYSRAPVPERGTGNRNLDMNAHICFQCAPRNIADGHQELVTVPGSLSADTDIFREYACYVSGLHLNFGPVGSSMGICRGHYPRLRSTSFPRTICHPLLLECQCKHG